MNSAVVVSAPVSAAVSISSEDEDWAVISDEFESMTVDDRDDEDGWDWCDTTTIEKDDRKEPEKEPEEDLSSSSSQQPRPIPIPGGYIHVTYKDMLLKRRREDEDSETLISPSIEGPPKSPWKARIIVQGAVPWKRVDREYGIRPPVVYDDDDDGMLLPFCLIIIVIMSSDFTNNTHHLLYYHITNNTHHLLYYHICSLYILDFGLEDIIAGEYSMKAHVGMCRVKAVTMMSAKQMEKKLARMAQKPSFVAAT